MITMIRVVVVDDKRRISRETRARRAWLRGAKIGGKDGALV